MPILASFGTVNDRAFGFGDSSFSLAYDLPAIITNNAEIIYDASNPLSYPGARSSFIFGAVFPTYNSNDRRYGDYWYIPVEKGTQIFPGDTIKNYPELEHTANVIDVERNVEIYSNWTGTVFNCDRVVIDSYMVYAPSVCYPSATTKWYDISGNDRNATLGGTPTLNGGGANKYFDFTNTNNAQVPSVFETPSGGGSADFVYYFVANITAVNAIKSTAQWGVNKFIFNNAIFFGGFSGSGGDTTVGDYDPTGWKLFRVTVNATYTDNFYYFSDNKSVRTYIGGQTGYVTSNITSNTGGDPTFSSFIASSGASLKFVSLYAPANDPGLTTVYNALKGRFGL